MADCEEKSERADFLAETCPLYPICEELFRQTACASVVTGLRQTATLARALPSLLCNFGDRKSFLLLSRDIRLPGFSASLVAKTLTAVSAFFFWKISPPLTRTIALFPSGIAGVRRFLRVEIG